MIRKLDGLYPTLLLDDAPPAGGGTPAAPAAAPAPEPAAPPPEPKPAPTVTLTVEQAQHYMGLERQLSEIRQAEAAKVEAAEREKNLALAKKGEVEQALTKTEEGWKAKLAESDGRYAQLVQRLRGAELTRVLTDALPIDRFVSGPALADARAKIEAGLEVVEDASGAMAVRERSTGRPVADVVAERLASPDFAHFLKPTTIGGAGGGGSKPAPAAGADRPKTASDVLIERHRAAHVESRNPYSPNAPRA